MNVEEFFKKRDEYKKLLAKEGKNMLKQLFLDFFKANPQVEQIQWVQYTPYFNDGEACVFRVCDPNYKIPDVSEKEDDEDDNGGFSDGYDIKDPVLKKAMSKFESSFEQLEEILEEVFGDHQQITAKVNKKGEVTFTAEDYEHD